MRDDVAFHRIVVKVTDERCPNCSTAHYLIIVLCFKGYKGALNNYGAYHLCHCIC